jgi:hypothetical protein
MKSIPTKHGAKPGHVRASLANKDDLNAIMKSKRLLKDSDNYKKVWIEGEKPREVMMMERNCRMLLREMGKEKDYFFKGSTLVKKVQRDGEDRAPQCTR